MSSKLIKITLTIIVLGVVLVVVSAMTFYFDGAIVNQVDQIDNRVVYLFLSGYICITKRRKLNLNRNARQTNQSQIR